MTKVTMRAARRQHPASVSTSVSGGHLCSRLLKSDVVCSTSLERRAVRLVASGTWTLRAGRRGCQTASLCSQGTEPLGARTWAFDPFVLNSTAWLGWGSCSHCSHARSHGLGHLSMWDKTVGVVTHRVASVQTHRRDFSISSPLGCCLSRACQSC